MAKRVLMPDAYRFDALHFGGPGSHGFKICNNEIIATQIKVADIANKLDQIVSKGCLDILNITVACGESESGTPLVIAKSFHFEKLVFGAACEKPIHLNIFALEFLGNRSCARNVPVAGALDAVKDFHLTRISMLIKARPLPIRAPINVSVGKWTPRTTRAIATVDAQSMTKGAAHGWNELINVPTKKAAEVWPEGKLKRSPGVIKFWVLRAT